MAYSLKFADSVRSFLWNVSSLSRQGRIKLYSALDLNLRQTGDTFRNEPSSRLPGGPPRFRHEIAVRDDDGDGQIHHFWFIVSDAAAAYGVLQIEYAEESRQPGA